MRLGILPQSLLESIALRLGRVPVPVGEGIFAMMLSRAVMAGVRLGIFAALEAGPLSASSLAARVRGDLAGVEALATALAASGYLVRRGDRFENGPVAARWMAPSSPHYLGNLLLFNYDHWEWWSRLEQCVLGGNPVEIHQQNSTEEELTRYILAMRDLAGLVAPEVARLLPVQAGARQLLDVGGSHGAYSAALCRRHPGLAATVFDLEPVARIAEPMVAQQGLGQRIRYRAGDATRDDLGNNYDVALLFQLLHHFPAEDARQLVCRVAGALRPGGRIALLEPARKPRPDQFAALLHLHYYLASRGGVHPHRDLEAWLREAGFRRLQARGLCTAPGLELLIADLPR